MAVGIPPIGSSDMERSLERLAPELRRLTELMLDTLDLEAETIRLRKKLHVSSLECRRSRETEARLIDENDRLRSESGRLRIKCENLEVTDKQKSMDLMEERRKNDELSRQLLEMCDNLLCITTNQSASSPGAGGGGGGGDEEKKTQGMRKRCFKLVRMNTSLTSQARLLRRQRNWAEAKAKVLTNELARVYLGALNGNVLDQKNVDELSNQVFEKFNADLRNEPQIQIYQPLLLNKESISGAQSAYYEVSIDFLTHLTQTGGEDIFGFLRSPAVYCEAIRDVCLEALGREFYGQFTRARRMQKLVYCVERLVSLNETEVAINNFVAIMCDLLQCDRATVWVVDRVRGLMWTRIKDPTGDKSDTLQITLPKNHQEASDNPYGLVTAAYLSKDVLNVTDAHEDHRFNKEMDQKSGYRTKSVLCLPVVRGKSDVRLVLQGVNKRTRSEFDFDDVFVLRLLGHVAVEVLAVCETSSSTSVNSKRKDNLMNFAGEIMLTCDSVKELLLYLEKGLQELFQVEAVRLHLVYGDHSKHLAFPDGPQRKRVEEVENKDGFSGVVGQAIKRREASYYYNSNKELQDMYRTGVDLTLPEGKVSVLHTVPFFEGQHMLSAVVQFTCLEREKRSFGDDGSYNESNRSHRKLLDQFLSYIQAYLTRWYPMKDRVRQTRRWGSVKKTLLPTMKMGRATLKATEDGGGGGEEGGDPPRPAVVRSPTEDSPPTDLKGDPGTDGKQGPAPSSAQHSGVPGSGKTHQHHVRIGDVESVEAVS